VSNDYYLYGLYGLFILPIFLGLIVYSIVRYKAFNVGVLGAQDLVATLVALVGSQFFFIQSTTSQVLNGVTLALILFFGYFLIKSVKREIESREHVERLALDLQNANVRLKELDAQKTEFISMATHQIRGPLGSIKGYASMLMEGDFGPLSDQARKGVEIMMRSAQSLIIVVNDYLDVSRIEQGRMKYDFSDFDLKDLAKTVVAEVRPVVEAAKLVLDFSCDESQTYMTHADMGKIKQIIGNLIDNAIKYTPSGSIHVTLEKKAAPVANAQAPGKILLSIKDTGVGIKPEVMPLLFVKFSRAPDASKTNILGTGLGLFVARKMMEAHKGRVWAESAGEGKGSQMYVELEELKV
jgi:signal transduction histidine kinase